MNHATEKAPLALRRQGLLHKCFPVKIGKITLNIGKTAHPPKIQMPMYG